jgi:NAD(P)-dependent dehydrogenase (short-subunit alcohol dehydrogenase family)
MKSFELNGRVVLITGAAGHLGKAICLQLAGAGAHVLVHGRSLEKLSALAETVRNRIGGKATTILGDVTNQEDLEKIVEVISRDFGRLDGLVNNAYSGAVGTIDTATIDQMRESLEMNLVSPFQLTQKLLPMMRKSNAPSIVNVASMYGMLSPDRRIYGESGFNSPPFYGAGKAGLIQLTRYLACHLATEKIRVNAISPGPFPPQSIKVNAPEFHDKLADKVPMERIGVADEVGGAVQFLLSDAASYITGVNIPIDGGWTAGSN